MGVGEGGKVESNSSDFTVYDQRGGDSGMETTNQSTIADGWGRLLKQNSQKATEKTGREKDTHSTPCLGRN
jgi:hypothetical protein